MGHLGTTQAAWILFFGRYAEAPHLLAFSLVAHLVFSSTRALLGILWLPFAYTEISQAIARGPAMAAGARPAVAEQAR